MLHHLRNHHIHSFPVGVLLIVLSTNSFAQNFTHINTPSITPLANARAQWADFNNDDLLDLFLSGVLQGGSFQTRIYFSNGDNTFNILDLPALTDIDFALADYDRDGFIDILMQGMDNAFQKHTRIFRNEGGSGFALQNFSFTPLSKGGVLWRDLDHDTDVDIIISGLNTMLEEVTTVYEWRDGNYFPKTSALIAVSNGRIKNIDVDRDGRAEVLLTGLDASGVARTILYSVNNSLQFELVNSSLPGSAFNNISISDLNDDSFEDFAVTGLSGAALEPVTQIFLNNGAGGFILTNTSIMNLTSASVATADQDHDGDADLILAGHDQNGLNYFKYYLNDGNASFSEMPTSVPGISDGETILGDYDNDGDLDIFIAGISDVDFQAAIYVSDQSLAIPNDPPDAPADLASVSNNNSVTFSWSASNDDHLSTITYNIYISKNTSGTDLVTAPNANVSSGYLKLPGYANAGILTSVHLKGLPEGKYYWSVQAVDQGLRVSAFSEQQTFSVCHTIGIGADTAICYNQNISLKAGDDADKVDWYSHKNGLLLSGSQNFVQSIKAADTIVVQVTKPFGCFVRDTVIVTMIDLPPISLGGDREICFQEEAVFEVSEPYSVNWLSINGDVIKANAHTYSFSVLQETTLVAQVVSELFHCLNYDTVTISPLARPVVTLGNDRQMCFGETAQFSTDDQVNVNWRTLRTNVELQDSETFYFKVLLPDTVIAEFEDENGCRGYDSVNIDVLPLPAAFIGNDTSVCFSEKIQVRFSGSAGQLQWTSQAHQVMAENVDQFLHYVLEQDTIQVRIVDENNCVNRDTIAIGVLPLPVFEIGNDTAVCSNGNILLKASPGFQQVNWHSVARKQNILSDSWYLNHHVITTDTIVAHVVSSHGCSNYDSIRVENLVLPQVDLGGDRSICAGDSILLEIPGAWENVTWRAGDIILGEGPVLNFQLQERLTISAAVMGAHNCIGIDTIDVSFLSLPSFDLGPAQHHCAGDEVTLSVNEGVNHLWTDVDGTPASQSAVHRFVASKTQWIYLSVENENGCLTKDSVEIVVNALPVLHMKGTGDICLGSVGVFEIEEQPFQSIMWSSATPSDFIGNNAWKIEQPLFTSTNIIATLTDLNGCSQSDSLFVKVHALPVALAGMDTLLCFGDQTVLGSHQTEKDLTFHWSPSEYLSNGSVAMPIATPPGSVHFFLTVTDSSGCSNKDSVYVEVNPQVIVEAGDAWEVCSGDPIELGGAPTATGSRFPYSFEWTSDNGSIVSTLANPKIYPKRSGQYYVFVTTGRCEVFMDSVSVNVYPLPELIVTPTCSTGRGGSVQLHASGANQYFWTPGNTLDNPTTSSPVASPLVNTRYFVRGLDVNGCADTASVNVLVQNTIFIPSLFTPNADGSNDHFKLYGSGIKKISLTIFNLSGVKMFHSEEIDQIFLVGWDGSHNGAMAGDDVYIWVISGQFHDGSAVHFNGHTRGIIKLMR